MAKEDAGKSALFHEEKGQVVLHGMVCGKCGHMAFPEQKYGCEKCGATGTDLKSHNLAARGTLLAYATVNLHYGKDIETPYVVGSIKLEDGLALRCTLIERDESKLEHGMTVAAKIFLNDRIDPENPKPELRFGRED